MVEWCVESGAPPERIAAHERMRPAAPHMYVSSPQTSSECMQQPLIEAPIATVFTLQYRCSRARHGVLCVTHKGARCGRLSLRCAFVRMWCKQLSRFIDGLFADHAERGVQAP